MTHIINSLVAVNSSSSRWRSNMIKSRLWLPVLSLLLTGLGVCPQPSNAQTSHPPTSVKAPPPGKPARAAKPANTKPAHTATNADLTQLFSRVWRITKAPSQPAAGSIYIFLPNGTLLTTSCGETYRIATWTIDKKAPRVLRVVEDGQLAFTAAIAGLTNTTLRLQQNLVRSNEKRDLTLTAVEQEFVCPDLATGK